MRSAAIAAVMLGILQGPALAEDAYLDDRSSPEALLQSLYNAINRKEYARAYDYFATPPAKDLEAYQKGYEDTQNVGVITGTPTAEGAAGSTYYQMPVAIRATATDGSERVFSGCYTLRLSNPQVQGSPYKPLHIEKASMKAAEGELTDVLPAQCGDGGEPAAADTVLAAAKALFKAVYANSCTLPAEDMEQPQSYAVPFNYSYDSEDTPKREARLFRFYCDRGAYNEMHVYLLANEEGGVSIVDFATPELDVQYEDGNSDGKVEDMRIIGYTAQDQLVNSDFDLDTLTITSHAKWRGVGDASSSGMWIFREGRFTLVKYEVDASYNGEIDPVTVLDYHTGP
ncbi:DUF1176 domain-containing protein [Nitratireductor indicus]|uniref:DUF1176 domain-containing protein n=1 Tax=Nitratireductor indicus TaxID=721133 RepID=UPI00287526D6|nr:DUF1176 domain-containing protein [Nitratireductor indicus]MDS1134869.1 DUF1176 domain-containing protein [Nitratireductor indicus]